MAQSVCPLMSDGSKLSHCDHRCILFSIYTNRCRIVDVLNTLDSIILALKGEDR